MKPLSSSATVTAGAPGSGNGRGALLASSARLLPLLDLTVDGGVGSFAGVGSLLLVSVPIAFTAASAAAALINLVVEFNDGGAGAGGVDILRVVLAFLFRAPPRRARRAFGALPFGVVWFILEVVLF